MEVISTGIKEPWDGYISTEETIFKSLKEEPINDLKITDIPLTTLINKYDVKTAQSYVNKYKNDDVIFVCQHIKGGQLNFENSLFFFTHSNKNDPSFSIPHYSKNVTERIDVSKKKELFSFVGNLNTHSIRKKLNDLYPNKVIKSNEWFDKNNLSLFKERTKNSYFGLCPRGIGIGTVRLWETMGSGTIPVIISDDYEKPLENIIDWDEFSVTIKEKDVEKTEEILKSYSIEDIEKMTNKAIEIYDTYFSNENLHKSILFYLNYNGYG